MQRNFLLRAVRTKKNTVDELGGDLQRKIKRGVGNTKSEMGKWIEGDSLWMKVIKSRYIGLGRVGSIMGWWRREGGEALAVVSLTWDGGMIYAKFIGGRGMRSWKQFLEGLLGMCLVLIFGLITRLGTFHLGLGSIGFLGLVVRGQRGWVGWENGVKMGGNRSLVGLGSLGGGRC